MLSNRTKQTQSNLNLLPPRHNLSQKLLERELGERSMDTQSKTLCQNCLNITLSNKERKSPVQRVMDWVILPNSNLKMLTKRTPDAVNSTKKSKIVLNSCINCRSIASPNYSLMCNVARKLPQRLQEMEHSLAGYDKIFSSVWLSNNQVVVGTKCQKLVIINVETGQQTVVTDYNSPLLCSNATISPQCSGIHSISINPSKTLLAVGAGKPNESISIYHLPTFDRIALLEGHDDLVFSVNWLNDTTLVSGSRDRSVKTWKLNQGFLKRKVDNLELNPPVVNVYRHAQTKVEHSQKVRDMVVDYHTSQFFTLSADGFVKVWDANRSQVVGSVPLMHTNETVCMGIDSENHYVTVGSQSHISLIDPREKEIVHIFDSLDEGWGVRSMCIHSDILTIGGGLGKMSFYDLRAMKYLEWESNNNPLNVNLQSGTGWLNKDAIYQRHFSNTQVHNAIYTVAYDASRTRFLAAGGPLQLNLKGSYVSLWE
ncbi:WD40-repeat-containing domain protein [Globomyces pollinis-pini]|nr:WD40-repeat-containing domain protein [Globomyces pollinis-pini]